MCTFQSNSCLLLRVYNDEETQLLRITSKSQDSCYHLIVFNLFLGKCWCMILFNSRCEVLGSIPFGKAIKGFRVVKNRAVGVLAFSNELGYNIVR